MAVTAKKIEGLRYLDPALACLRPPEQITVSQWADQYRILTSETSPEPGPYRTSRTPYCKIPMDCFGDPDVEHVVLCWASQTGKTDLLLNLLAYAIDQDPGPALLTMPTEDLGRFISRNRIGPMVEACTRLREKKPDDPDEYQRLEMRFKGMILSIIGANSPASLSHRPVRFLFRDEVNKFPFFAGKESDPMSLSRERTKNFWNRKIFDVSTPSIETGNITKELESCDVVFDFYVPCPHCGVYQILKFEQIKWPKKEKNDESISPDEAKKTAWYECEVCKQPIADIYKSEMLRSGEWRSRGETDIEFGKYILDHHPRKVGFHLPAWYSPWLTWGDCAGEFLSSKDFPEKLMNFRNSWEAEPWTEKYETKSEKQILANAIDLAPFVCPSGTVGLTAGIDPSSDGFYFTVLSWTRDMSPHLIHYDFCSSWDEIKALIWECSYFTEGSEKRWPIWRAGIDTGGGSREGHDQTMTEEVYDFLRQYGKNRIFGTKGMSHFSTHKIKISKIDKTPQGQSIRGGIMLVNIDVGRVKDSVFYRLQLEEGSPGRFTFHKETSNDFVGHLLAEEKRVDFKTGQASWVKVRRANHWLDATVLAFAMADPEFGGGIKIVGSAPRPNQSAAISGERSWIRDY